MMAGDPVRLLEVGGIISSELVNRMCCDDRFV